MSANTGSRRYGPDTYDANARRYDKAVNISKHSRDVEVTDDGKTATVRMETGDAITDHILQHNANGDLLNLEAIQGRLQSMRPRIFTTCPS
eukprot:1272609-Rhodomonas_salina.1